MTPEFTHTCVDSDSVTVRNKKRVAVTFSFGLNISMAKYDRTLEYIKRNGWTNLKLITHTPLTDELAANRRDDGTDGKLTKSDLRILGVTGEEFDRMYRYAQGCIIDNLQKRLNAI